MARTRITRGGYSVPPHAVFWGWGPFWLSERGTKTAVGQVVPFPLLLILLLILFVFLIPLLFPVNCSYLYLWSLPFVPPIPFSILLQGDWKGGVSEREREGWVECFSGNTKMGNTIPKSWQPYLNLFLDSFASTQNTPTETNKWFSSKFCESWDRIYLLQAKEASEWTWDLLKMRHRGHCEGGAGKLEFLIPGTCLCLQGKISCSMLEDFLLEVGCTLKNSKVPNIFSGISI